MTNDCYGMKFTNFILDFCACINASTTCMCTGTLSLQAPDSRVGAILVMPFKVTK